MTARPNKNRVLDDRRWLMCWGCLALLISGGCNIADPAYLAEGQSFAEAAINAVGKDWDASELVRRADPLFLQALPEPRVREMVATCSRDLGPLKRATTQLATVGLTADPWIRKRAQFTMRLDCEKKEATAVVAVRKRNDQWRIVAFYVDIKD